MKRVIVFRRIGGKEGGGRGQDEDGMRTLRTGDTVLSGCTQGGLFSLRSCARSCASGYGRDPYQCAPSYVRLRPPPSGSNNSTSTRPACTPSCFYTLLLNIHQAITSPSASTTLQDIHGIQNTHVLPLTKAASLSCITLTHTKPIYA